MEPGQWEEFNKEVEQQAVWGETGMTSGLNRYFLHKHM